MAGSLHPYADPQDICLGDSGAFGEVGLAPARFDPPLANRVPWVVKPSDGCEVNHDLSICVIPHDGESCAANRLVTTRSDLQRGGCRCVDNDGG